MLCFNKTQPLNRGWCSATLLLYNYSYNLLKELLLWVMSENMLPCFSSVTHIMVAPVRFSGMHLKLLLPWPGLGFWMGRISSPSSTSSRWMNDWRILAWFWRVYDDHGGDAVGHEPPPPPLQRSHRRKRSRSFEDDEEGHLIYHNGLVLKARCIEHQPFFL